MKEFCVVTRSLILGMSVATVVACSTPDTAQTTAQTTAQSLATALSPQPAPYVLGQGAHKMPTCGPVGAALDSAIAAGKIATTALSWATWEIPEFQDEQRFVDKAAGDYGPRACIVAAPHLEQVAEADYHKLEGVLVAVAYVYVSIPNIDPMTAAYADLYLVPEFNCVVMRRDAANKWEGYVTKSADRVCQPINASKKLNVVELSARGLMVPPVSRFQIKRSSKPSIGVRCLTGWCTIGTSGDLRVAAHGTAPTNHPNFVHRNMPGWFDDQDLAVADPAKPTKLIPRHWASVIPDKFLGSYNFANDFDVAPTRVATIHFKGRATGKYLTHWGFGSNAAEKEYELSLKRLSSAGSETWAVYIDGALRRRLKVIHTDHSAFGVHIWGTARWAWKDDDEGIWVRCDEGCCQVVADPGI